MICIKSDRIITPRGLVRGNIYVENGKITEITPKAYSVEDIIDMSGKYVAPGFIDIHTHGGGGYSFTESSQEDIVRGCEFHLAHGTTSIVPTVTTGAFDVMREAALNIKAAVSFQFILIFASEMSRYLMQRCFLKQAEVQR